MNLKRYMVAQCCGFGGLEESPHGDFVHIDDYDALVAELAELQRKLERYEAIKRADIETLHEFADHLAYKRALEEG